MCEVGTLFSGSEVKVTMKKAPNHAKTHPLPLFCTSEEASTVRAFMAKVGDKWSVMVIVLLGRTSNRARFSELQRSIVGISQRMLSTTLRGLERDGLVHREAFAEVPPRVEYSLTPRGLSLLEPLQHLVGWIGDNWEDIKRSRAQFDSGAT